MKSRNLPKIFSYVTICAFAISLFGVFIDPVSFFIIYYFGLIISPISVVILIVWKFYNKSVKNPYFIPILITDIIFFIISFYMTLHAFDNLVGI